MRTILYVLLFCSAMHSALAEDNPLTSHNRSLYVGVKHLLVRSAEKMPEEHYAFRPVDSVRTYGQIIGHIADSQYTFCAAVLGEKNPSLKIEKTKTTKADLVAAIKDSCAYCDKAYNSLNDQTATELVTIFAGDTPKLGILNINNVHNIEHYGNLITYMRMKDIVPPSSEPGFIPEKKK